MSEPEDTSDYVTMTRCGPDSSKWLVAIMRYNVSAKDHVMREVSAELTYHGAVHLASQWSKEKGLEMRYTGRRK